jgi:hypothetical protein
MKNCCNIAVKCGTFAQGQLFAQQKNLSNLWLALGWTKQSHVSVPVVVCCVIFVESVVLVSETSN